MSAGRRRVHLEDLRGVAEDGFLTSVHHALLGAEVRGQVVPSLKDVTHDALESGLGEWSSGLPADWQFRTTDEDVRALAGERARARLARKLHPMVDALVGGYRLHERYRFLFTAEDARLVKRVLTECYRAEVRDLPKTYSPIRKPGRIAPEPRTGATPSQVVTRYVNGDVTIDGEDVTVVPAEALMPPEHPARGRAGAQSPTRTARKGGKGAPARSKTPTAPEAPALVTSGESPESPGSPYASLHRRTASCGAVGEAEFPGADDTVVTRLVRCTRPHAHDGEHFDRLRNRRWA